MFAILPSLVCLPKLLFHPIAHYVHVLLVWHTLISPKKVFMLFEGENL